MKRTISISSVLLLCLPLLALLHLSLVSAMHAPGLFESRLTWRHWSEAFQGHDSILENFSQSLLFSAALASLATGAGFLFSKHIMLSKRPSFIRSAYYPFLIAPVVFSSMLQFYFVKAGLMGNWFGVFLAQSLFLVPFAALLLSSFWNATLRGLIDVSTNLGLNAHQTNKQVVWPLAKSWLLFCWGLCFLFSWFEYGMTKVIGVGKVKTMTVAVMRFVNEANIHQAAVASLLMILPLVAIGVVAARFSVLFRWR